MSSEDASNSRSCETKYSPKKRGAKKKLRIFRKIREKSQEQMKRRKKDENCSDIR